MASVPGLGVGLFALDYPLMEERHWDTLRNFTHFAAVADHAQLHSP